MGRFVVQSSEHILKAPLAAATMAVAARTVLNAGPDQRLLHDGVSRDGAQVIKLDAHHTTGVTGRWRHEIYLQQFEPAAPELAAATRTIPAPGMVIRECVFDPNHGKVYTTYHLTQIAPNRTSLTIEADVRMALRPEITERLWRQWLSESVAAIEQAAALTQAATPSVGAELG